MSQHSSNNNFIVPYVLAVAPAIKWRLMLELQSTHSSPYLEELADHHAANVIFLLAPAFSDAANEVIDSDALQLRIETTLLSYMRSL